MRKTEVSVWALATFGFAWLLFALVMPVFNRVKDSGEIGRAYSFLLIPLLAQALLLTGGGLYSLRRKRREVVTGILCGFGLELAAITVLIIISASAHY